MALTLTRGSLSEMSPTVRYSLGGAVVVLCAVIYYVFFFSEVSDKIRRAEAEQTRFRAELVEVQHAQANYFADRDELASRQQRQREFNKILPPTAEMASFLSAIQNETDVSGVSLKSWQPFDEQPVDFYVRVPMKLELTGKFHQLVKFIYDLGHIERIINVENIEFSDPRMIAGDTILRARCLATTFYAAEPKPVQAVTP